MSWLFHTESRSGSRRGRNSFSSRTSLASGITSSSVESSSSNATMTPEILSRRRTRTTSKGSLNSSKPHSNPPLSSSPKTSAEETKHPATRQASKVSAGSPPVDVFNYLDAWESRTSSRLSLAESAIDNTVKTTSRVPTMTLGGEIQSGVGEGHGLTVDPREAFSKSSHSDSGIWIRDTSSEQSPHATRSGSISSEVFESDGSPREGIGKILVKRQDISMEEAESFYRRGSPQPRNVKQSNLPSELPHSPIAIPTTDELSPKISMTNLPSDTPRSPTPLYQTFERSTHRVLDSLQDDIIQLEGILDRIDKRCLRSSNIPLNSRASSCPIPLNPHPPTPPQHLLPSFDYQQRREVLEHIRQKLEHYNQLLYSSQTVQKSFPPASAAQIEEHLTYLRRKGTPLTIAENHHLSNQAKTDFIVFHQTNSDTTSTLLRTTLALSLIAIATPLLSFHLINIYAARFALLAILTFWIAIAWRVLDLNSTLGVSDHESRAYLFGYFGVMTCAALLC